MTMTKAQNAIFFILVSVIALGFLKSPGTVDVNAFMMWTQNAAAHGIVGGYYVNDADYPPLTTALLYGIAGFAQLLQLDLMIGFKLTLFLFLLASAGIFWAWTRNLFLAAIFELSLILSSTGLGYTDITYTPTLLLSLWALQQRKLFLFTLLYGASCLIKWQPIIIAPILFIYMLNVADWRDWRQVDVKSLAKSVLLPAVVVLVLLLVIFGPELYWSFSMATSDGLLSGNALNFNWLITHFMRHFLPSWFGGLDNGLATWIDTKDERITTLPKALFITTYLATCYIFWRRPKTFKNAIFYALLGFLSYFMFNTGVHENHLYVGALLAAVLYALEPTHLVTFATWALAANANLFFFYGANGQGVPFDRVAFIDVALLLSLLNLLFFLLLFVPALRRDPHTAPELVRSRVASGRPLSLEPELGEHTAFQPPEL
jgi:hypothetical protein